MLNREISRMALPTLYKRIVYGILRKLLLRNQDVAPQVSDFWSRR